ncbi:LOW QUALITY PROTEIN: hypothetical protein AAY473_040660 [Plecturocebus cupreus]
MLPQPPWTPTALRPVSRTSHFLFNPLPWITSCPTTCCPRHQLQDHHHQGLKGKEGSCGGGGNVGDALANGNTNEKNEEQEADNEVDEKDEESGEEEQEKEEFDGEEEDGDKEAKAATGKRAAEEDDDDDDTKEQKTHEDD